MLVLSIGIIMKVSDLFESIILEARHDDVFNNQYSRIMALIDEHEALSSLDKKYIFDEAKKEYDYVRTTTSFKNLNPLWKLYLGELYTQSGCFAVVHLNT